LAHNANAKKVREFLQAVSDGKMMLDVIEIDAADPSYILGVRDRIERGELVALLGDRLGINERDVVVPFFGAPARFPAGPFLLASILGCPVLLVFGLFFPPNRYEVVCERFVEKVELPRGRRDAALQELVAGYAARLEHHCRRAPDNWFNFYDFWAERDSTDRA
jgi:predicted LPLAT superfamily acyltransferase